MFYTYRMKYTSYHLYLVAFGQLASTPGLSEQPGWDPYHAEPQLVPSPVTWCIVRDQLLGKKNQLAEAYRSGMPGGKSGRDTHHCTSFSGLTLEQATHLVWCAWVNLVRQCAPQIQLHFTHLFLGGGRRKMSRWELKQKTSQPEFWSQVVLLHHLQGEGGEERQRLRHLCRLCTVAAQPTQLLCSARDQLISCLCFTPIV